MMYRTLGYFIEVFLGHDKETSLLILMVTHKTFNFIELTRYNGHK